MTQRNNILQSIQSLLEFIEKIEGFIFSSSNNEIIKEREFTSVDSNKTSEILSKLFSSQQTIAEVKENITRIKTDIEQQHADISLKFYLHLTNQFNNINQEYASLGEHLSAQVRREASIKELIQSDAVLDKALESYMFNFATLSPNVLQFLERLHLQMNLIMFFDAFKETQKNMIMIGPNGCGKSTFARQIAQNFQLGATVIGAQKMFLYEPAKEVVTTNTSQQVTQFLKEEKSGKNWDSRKLYENILNFDLLIKYLIREHNTQASKEHGGIIEKKLSLLEKSIEIWNQIIIHRQLKYDCDTWYIEAVVSDNEDQTYPYMQLSDGEKTVFHYIINVMLAEKDSYIIVDEPENHLNLAIVNQLWDRLEQERSDCQFIYLTHSPDFTVGRINSSIFWIRNLFPTDGKVKYIEIPSMEEISRELMVLLVGSRKKILFCEGEKNSLDYQVYSVLFPEYTVIPVGGCKEVISHTRTYNNTELFHNSAIGIVDGDYRGNAEISSLNRDSIYCLMLPEIENLLCDELLLQAACYTFKTTDPNATHDAKERLFSLLDNDKEKQTTLYVRHITTEKMKLPKMQNNIESLMSMYNDQIPDQKKIRCLYDERLHKIQAAVKNKDFEAALRLYNCKSIITISNKIVDDYKHRIIGVLRDSKENQDTLKQKYFLALPDIKNTDQNNRAHPIKSSFTN